MNTFYNHFTKPLLSWSKQNGRKNLPWQTPRSPYRVWISEVMLQQTQVRTVIPYFDRFMHRFPDIFCLANAEEDEVLGHWSGLGYYSRARNIHKTAKIIATDYHGSFPNDIQKLIKLPGIGESTAAAIASLAFNQPAAILDGNVKRVLSRYFLVEGTPNQAATRKKLWQLAKECMAVKQCAEYTQAIMDLGATCCTLNSPSCNSCPVSATCLALKTNQVKIFPNKAPKKSKPVKREQFLLIHNNDHLIYLEKRPPVGIWGGLWSLPSIENTDNPAEFINNHYNFSIINQKALLEIKHTFSHFHLQINAISLEVQAPSNIHIAESNGRWYTFEEIKQLGIAKPVHEIINHFFRPLD